MFLPIQTMLLIKARTQCKEAKLSLNKEFKVKTELDTQHTHSSNRQFKLYQAYKSDQALLHTDHPAVDIKKVIVLKRLLLVTKSLIKN